MIKTTIKNLMQSNVGLSPLVAARLPAKAKYSVTRLAAAINGELEKYSAARAKIFEEAGCTVVEGEYVHDDADVMTKAKAESADLVTAEVEISALPLDIEQFGSAEIEGPAFFGLDWAMKPEAPTA